MSSPQLDPPYSPLEEKAISLLQKAGATSQKPLSSDEVVKSFYPGVTDRPFYARQIVVGILNRAIAKNQARRDDFIICKSKRSGPIAINYWIEKQ